MLTPGEVTMFRSILGPGRLALAHSDEAGSHRGGLCPQALVTRAKVAHLRQANGAVRRARQEAGQGRGLYFQKLRSLLRLASVIPRQPATCGTTPRRVLWLCCATVGVWASSTGTMNTSLTTTSVEPAVEEAHGPMVPGPSGSVTPRLMPRHWLQSAGWRLEHWCQRDWPNFCTHCSLRDCKA